VQTPNRCNIDASLVLASASPRRRALLGLLGISFCVHAADVDEMPLAAEGPAALTTRLARAKALMVVDSLSGSPAHAQRSISSRNDIVSETSIPTVSKRESNDLIVLAADTVVVLNGAILGKPGDDREATAMLASLRGRAHRVLTGVALAAMGEIVWSSVVTTTVWMRDYGDDELERYVRSGSPLDKAGAYGIQDADFRPVERIDGCLANVVGLPLCEVRRALIAIDPDRSWGPTWRVPVAREAGPCPDPVVAGPDQDCTLCERARHI
jgi:septum formation protein